MTSPKAQMNIKQRDLLPSISLPDDVSAYAFFRRSIQGWGWHPIRCLYPLHSGPGAPGSRGRRPSPFDRAALSPQHHCCWMRNIATHRLLWPEPRISRDPEGSCAKSGSCFCGSTETRDARIGFGALHYTNPQYPKATTGSIRNNAGELDKPRSLWFEITITRPTRAREKQTHPSWLTTNLSKLRDCNIKERGRRRRGGVEDGAPFSRSGSRARLVSFCEPKPNPRSRCGTRPGWSPVRKTRQL